MKTFVVVNFKLKNYSILQNCKSNIMQIHIIIKFYNNIFNLIINNI